MWIPIRFEVRGLYALIGVQVGRMAGGMKLVARETGSYASKRPIYDLGPP